MQVEKATDNATDTTSYSLFDFDFVRTSTRSTPLAAYAAGPASALTTDGGGSKETPPKLTETDHMLSGDMVSSAWSRLTLFVLTRSSPFFVWCVGCSQSPPQKGLYKGDFPHWSKVKKAGLEVSKKLKRLNFPGTFLGLERL